MVRKASPSTTLKGGLASMMRYFVVDDTAPPRRLPSKSA